MIKLKSLIKESFDDEEYAKWRQSGMSAADREHSKTLSATGFWGKQGAGSIILAKSTSRLLLPFRSARVEQSNTWGVWGGAIDEGDDPKATVKKEMKEEVGYTGTILDIIPLYVFKDQRTGFQYHNFITIVPEEFQPKLNWETEDYDWVDFGDWPQPLHFGLKALIQQSGNDIKKIIEKDK